MLAYGLVLSESATEHAHMRARVCGCTHQQAMPTEIVPGRLFLGHKRHAANLPLLRRAGVNAVLNATEEVPHYFPGATTLRVAFVGVRMCVRSRRTQTDGETENSKER